MNRQLKRANEKSDKRREREQERRKTQRRENRVRAVQTKRDMKSAAKSTDETKKSGGGSSKSERPAPGMGRSRLAGAYLILVIGIIASQAFVPQRTDTFSLVTQTLFYVILSYFLVLWFYRRGVEQAAVITLAATFGLAVGVEGIKFLWPQLGLPQMTAPEGSSLAPNLLFIALAVPGLLLGTWFGRFIYRRS